MESLECRLCFEKFRKEGNYIPLVFRCGHSACTQCVSTLSKDKTVECPTCRGKSKMPLVKNFAILDALDAIASGSKVTNTRNNISSTNKMDENDVNCENCGEMNFSFFCNECSNYLCVACNNQIHQRGKMVNHHREAVRIRLKAKLKLCKVHQNEETRWYCNTCNTAICELCYDVNGAHRSHNYSRCATASLPLKRAATERLQSAQAQGDKAYNVLLQLEALQHALGDPSVFTFDKVPDRNDSSKKEHVSSRANAINIIAKHFRAIRSLVTATEMECLRRVDQEVAAKSTAMKRHSELLQANLADLNDCEQNVNNMVSSTDVDACISYSSVMDSLSVLQSQWAPFNITVDSAIPINVRTQEVLSSITSSYVIGGPSAPTEVEVMPRQGGFKVVWAKSEVTEGKLQIASYIVDIEIVNQAGSNTMANDMIAATSTGQSACDYDNSHKKRKYIESEHKSNELNNSEIKTYSFTIQNRTKPNQAIMEFSNNDKVFEGQTVVAFVTAVDVNGSRGGVARSAPVALAKSFSVTLTYVSDFDKNGLFYYIGTAGGTQPYVNPHVSGDVKVTWSGIGGGKRKYGIVNYVATQQLTSMSHHKLSGRFMHTHGVVNDGCAWMEVDIGVSRRLLPNNVTVKAQSNTDSRFVLEAKLKCEEEWITLTQEITIGKRFKTQSIQREINSKTYFRYFRLIENANGTGQLFCDSLELFCDSIELYGTLMLV